MHIFKTQDPKYNIAVQMNKDTGEPSAAFLVNAATGVGIPTSEPIFMLRAKDKHAVASIEEYAFAVNSEEHSDSVQKRIDAFRQYAKDNPTLMKEPDTAP